MFKVGFVQWQAMRDPPHMNMPLFVRDIKDLGCDVECVCVNRNKLEEFIKYFKYQKFNLLATDYLCLYSIIAKIKEINPCTKIVVGGNGFFDIFLKTEIDFGIIDAGRKSIVMLADALKNNKDLSQIPNLFLKYKKGSANIIDYSGKDIDFNLRKELFPYVPYLKWKYIGFENNANELVNKVGSPPTVIADFGCPYRSSKLRNNCRAIGDLELSNCMVTNKAQIRLKKLFNERLSGGCVFCTSNAYFSLPVEQTNNYLISQMRYLQKEYGFDKFSIGSEYLFRFLLSLINQIFEEKIRLKQINIRSRIDWLLKSEKTLIKALNFAVKHGFKITIWQLGFESFHQKLLDLYNKKQLVEENLKAIKLLDGLEKKYKENFSNLIETHGMLGITPWTKKEDIIEEFKILKRLPLHWRERLPFLPTRTSLNAKLDLIDPFLPIYKKIKNDGLLIRNNDSLDGFEFMDTEVRRVRSYLNSGLIYEKNKKYNAAIKMHRKVLRILPNNCYIYFILGRLYFRLKKYKYAIKKTTEAQKLGCAGSDIHFLLGFSYERIKKYRQAIKEFKKGEKINPESPKEVSFCLAKCYKHIGQVRLFDKKFKKGLQKLKSII